MALVPMLSYRFVSIKGKAHLVSVPYFYGAEKEYNMAKKTKSMAKAFDIATCENGHPRYILGKSIREGTRVSGDDFVPIGDSVKVTVSVQLFDMKCPQCGGKVFAPTDDGNYGLKFYNRSVLVGEGKYVEGDNDSARDAVDSVDSV